MSSFLLNVKLLFFPELLGVLTPILGPFIILGYSLEALGEIIDFFRLDNKNFISLLNLMYVVSKAASVAIVMTFFVPWLPLLLSVAMGGLIFFNLGSLYQYIVNYQSEKSKEAREAFKEKLQDTVLTGLSLTTFGLLLFFPGSFALAICCLTLGSYLFCIMKSCYQRYNSQATEIDQSKPLALEKTPEEIKDLSDQLLKKAAQLFIAIKNSKGTIRESLFHEELKREAKIFVLMACCVLLNKSEDISLLFKADELKNELETHYYNVKEKLTEDKINNFKDFLNHEDYQPELRQSRYSFFRKQAETAQLVETCLVILPRSG